MKKVGKYKKKIILLLSILVVISFCLLIVNRKNDHVVKANTENNQAQEGTSNFDYVLERNDNKLEIVDVTIAQEMDKVYQTINIKTPNHVTLAEENEFPTSWVLEEQTIEENAHLYTYQMADANDVATIKNFLENTTLIIAESYTDTVGDVSIYFQGRTSTNRMAANAQFQETDAEETDWVESTSIPDFNTPKSEGRELHYTFNQPGTTSKVAFLPNVYIKDYNRSSSGTNVLHIYRTSTTSSSLVLSFIENNSTVLNRYYASQYAGAKFYTRTKNGYTQIKAEADKTLTLPSDGTVINYQYRTDIYPLSDGKIRHTVTITNTGANEFKFIASKYVDTELDSDDTVPVYMYGKNKGMYILSRDTKEYKYKLIYDFDNLNGPDQFTNGWTSNPTWDNTSTTNYLFQFWNPANRTGTGQELLNLQPDEIVPSKKSNNDTAINMKWSDTVALKTGESQEFTYDISMIADYSLSSTYENKRDATDVNRPGDMLDLRFLVSKASNKFTSTGGTISIPLSNYLEFNENQPIILYKSDGTILRTIADTANVFDEETQTIKIDVTGEEVVNAGTELSLTFQAQLTPDSASKTFAQKANSTIILDNKEIKKEVSMNITVAESLIENECVETIPQKVYISGYTLEGNQLSEGDQVVEEGLRISKEKLFVPQSVSKFRYVELQQNDEVVSSEKFLIGGEKQEAKAIYASLAILHVKQVTLSPNESVVVPTIGNATIYTTETLGGERIIQLPINYVSETTNNQSYTDLFVEIFTPSYYLVKPRIPQYYHYEGYTLTDSDVSHESLERETGLPTWDAQLNQEIWLTIYISPSTSNPGFYHSDYGQQNKYTIVE